MIWVIASVVLIVLAFVVPAFINADRFLLHTLYLSGTLGAGKTSFAAWAVRRLIKRGFTIYATFVLEGAIPFDLSSDPWPKGKKVVVILDEMLWLRLEKFFTDGHLSGGLTMARQRKQVVMILSQTHLSEMGVLDGPIQVFATTVPLLKTSFGNLNMMRFSSNKFKRNGKIKAPGMKTIFLWIPARIWADYNSELIYGFTCDKDRRLFTEEEMKLNAIRRAARFRLEKQLADQLARDEAKRMVAAGEFQGLDLVPGSPPRAAQDGPQARPVGAHEVPPAPGSAGGARGGSGAPWHRPGGRASRGGR